MSQLRSSAQPEPWLRGTLTEVPPVPRAVLHALQLAQEDLHKWCGDLTENQLNARPANLASVAQQLHHIAGSLDRLLTYAEGSQLSEAQLQSRQSETDAAPSREVLFAQLDAAFERSAQRILALSSLDFAEPRTVGKKQLPTTLGGLLVHVADHTQRHIGQAIVTAKLVTLP